MRYGWILSILALGMFCRGNGSLGQTLPDPASPPHFIMGTDFRLFHGYIIVARGAVGELHDLNFLIDTGAVPTVISERLARKLRLQTESAELSTFTQLVKARETIVPELSLGPIRVQQQPVLVENLDFIKRGIGVRVDAMIGLDVLGWCNFAIDYQAKKLIFGARLPDSPHVPFEVGPGCMLVSAKVGDNRLRLMIDTGSKRLMLFEDGFREMFPNARVLRNRESRNLGGQETLREVELPPLKLNGVDFGPVETVLVETAKEATPDFDGLLGLRSLGLSKVYFDFNRQMLSYRRSEVSP